MSEDTKELARIAPTLATWPRFMRRLPATAFWTAITVLFLGAASLFWRTVSMGTDAALIHKDLESIGELKTALKETNTHLAAVDKDLSAIHQYQHDMDEEEKKRNPYVRHPGKVIR